jgi:UDP-glucose 4-epimerase
MSDRGAVLVTGGAGYIGSHTVLALKEAGYTLIVLDDLSTGFRGAVPQDVTFIEGDVANLALTESVMHGYGVDAVVHFAGSIVVPESVSDPLAYYHNNTVASRSLIEACVRTGVHSFVFSSTAAVYGEPATVPIDENCVTNPTNPYGRSKLATEWILRDTAVAHGLRYVALRYFNVAGADPLGRTGQKSRKATHLIKVASQVVVGLRDHIDIFGDDYDTPDGTCVRDYIHVSDLARAHVDALAHLDAGGQNLTLNCGYGCGYSVRQVLDTVETVIGQPIDIRSAARRPGDPAQLIADASEIMGKLNWRPRYNDLEFIVRSAIVWERKLSAAQSQES